MAGGLEVFGNCSSCVAGSTSGTTNPGANTSESWTMSTGYTSFPTASTSATPNTYFFIRDPADTTNEICQVTAGGGGTTSWTVIRGINGATVAHATGATWVQVVAPYTLQNFKQASNVNTTAIGISNSATETVVAVYTPFSGEIVAGCAYEIYASGTFGISTTGTIPTLQWTLYSGGSGTVDGAFTSTGSTVLAQMVTGSTTTTIQCPPLATTTATTTLTTTTTATTGLPMPGPWLAASRVGAGTSFNVSGLIEWITTATAAATLEFNWTVRGINATFMPTVGQIGVANSVGTAGVVTPANVGPMFLTVKWSAAATSNAVTIPASFIVREA